MAATPDHFMPAPSAPPEASLVTAAPRALHLEGGAVAVLLFHGLSSSPLELQYVGRGLHRAGYTVRAPVFEGYSMGGARKVPSRSDVWESLALAEFDALQLSHAAVVVGGLCVGSLLALRVGAARPQQVSALLALSTSLHYDGWAMHWMRHLLGLSPFVPLSGRIAIREREPFGVKDARLRMWIGEQMKTFGGSAAGASRLKVRDLVEAQRLGRRVRQTLHRIVAPTLVLHASEDESSSTRSADEVARGISSARVRTVILDDCYHMITIDQERRRVLAEMQTFIAETVPAMAGGLLKRESANGG